MAAVVTTPVWTEDVAMSWTADDSPAKDVEATTDIDMAALGYFLVDILLELEFAGGIDGNATITVLSSVDNGTTWGEFWSQEVTYDAGNTVNVPLTFSNKARIRVAVLNGSASEAELTLTGTYAGLKYSSE